MTGDPIFDAGQGGNAVAGGCHARTDPAADDRDGNSAGADPAGKGEDIGEDVATAHVDLVIEDRRWLAADLPALAERAVAATLARLECTDASVSLLACDDARICGLNGDFRAKPQPTNVLSWPAVEHLAHPPGAWPDVPLLDEMGDIAIAWDTCAREAVTQGKPFADHVTHLLVHATLHVAGFDHQIPEDAATMEQTERSILAEFGIPDPYEDDRPQ